MTVLRFSEFLTEGTRVNTSKLQHLEHVEDLIFSGGNDGVEHVGKSLDDVAGLLDGKKSRSRVTIKHDGAPGIVFGINPENGKFFVATKSAFNKTPKLNYTDRDIETNHGNSPGLVEKLCVALRELPKVMPKTGGVFQGDVMYTRPDVSEKDDRISFTPNTITYSAKKDSAQARRVTNSELGVVVHTKYVGKTLSDMTATPDVDQGHFRKDPAVNMISPEIGDVSDISGVHAREYQKHIDRASELMGELHHDTLDTIKSQAPLIRLLVNKHVREGGKLSVSSYLSFLKSKAKTDIGALKTDAGRERVAARYDKLIGTVESNRDEFQRVFDMHSAIASAKDSLIKGLASVKREFDTTIGGKPTKPEGFVVIRNGVPMKLVDRSEFSAANFARGPFRKKPDDGTINPMVFSFGRMNPPTAGHGVLVDRVLDLAKERKAKHRIVLTGTQDPENNPLSPEQKLKHAKRAFPVANIEVAGKSDSTIMAQMKKLYDEGIDHVVVVAGSDRVDEFKELLDKYNGSSYEFKRIDVVSSGNRDPDSDDERGMSASRLRLFAVRNRYKDFARGVPKSMHPEHTREMFDDVKQGMNITIDQNTSGISLARYAKRDDPIGVRARREVQRRLLSREAEKRSKAVRGRSRGKKPT